MATNYRLKKLRAVCSEMVACDGDNADPEIGVCGKCRAAIKKREKGLKPPKGVRISGELVSKKSTNAR